MAVKTFTSEVLTSADTNTYLANAGLVYVSSTTIGNAVSSVTVSNCFNSTYDAYRIILRGGTTSTSSTQFSFNFNGAPSAWYGNLIYANFASGAPASVGYNNTTGVAHGASASSGYSQALIDVRSPFLATPSFFWSSYVDGSNAGTVQATNANSTSYTGFVLTILSGTFTGGTITVYGYRKA